MKKVGVFITIVSMCVFAACGGEEPEQQEEQIKIRTQRDRESEKPAEEPMADASEDAMNNEGIGPVENVELGEIDQGLVSQGKEVFDKNCTACHKIEKRYIGPPIAGVTERRTPEWIMNMILNPTEMIQKDPLAKQLMGEYNGAVMADQNISEEQARALLEYFRTLEAS